MKYKVLSSLLALSVLACLSPCENDDVNKAVEITEKESAVSDLPAVGPSDTVKDSIAEPASPFTPADDGDTEPPPPSEPDYHSLAAETLAAVWDGNIPGTAEVSEEMDSISNHDVLYKGRI